VSGAKSESGKPESGEPGSGKPGSGKPGSDKPGSDKPGSDKPGSVKAEAKTLLVKARGALTAAATLCTAVLGVLFLLVPSLKPLSRDKIEASLTVPTVETQVDLFDWATRQYPGRPRRELHKLLGHPYGPNDAGAGLVVYVQLQADGFKRRAIKLRARIYDSATRRPSTDLLSGGQILPQSGRLRIDAPSRSSVQLMLLNDFSRVPGRRFVRVEAYDDGGILAYADSKTIVGEGTPPLPKAK
jgi:hypothetical protein